MRFSLAGTAVSAAALVVPLVVVAPASTPATAAGSSTSAQQQCRGMNKLIKQSPRNTASLAGGATLQVWDNKKTKKWKKKQFRKINRKYAKKKVRQRKKDRIRIQRKRHLRIVAATIPRTSPLKGHTYARTGVTGLATSAYHASLASDAVVVTNGSVFSVTGKAPARGPQIVEGEIRKIGNVFEGAVVTLASGRTDFARLRVTGSAWVDGEKYSFAGINTATVAYDEITMYTSAWGTAARPSGVVDVVVDEATGTVLEVRSGSERGVIPTVGTYVLTADGPSGEGLALVLPGMSVQLDHRVVARSTDGTKTDLALTDPVRSAVGYSAMLMSNGVIKDGQCTTRNELKRPRTVYGRKANGDVVVMTVSGRYGKHAGNVGGASMKQALRYIKQIGAVDAVILDGGGSTTLLLRKKAGGSLVRYDRGKGVGTQRRVGNAFGFAPGTP